MDEGKGRIFPCEGCGADLHFSIDMQKLRCPYCSFHKDIELDGEVRVREQDFAAMLEKLREQKQSRATDETTPALQEVRCESCSASVQFSGTLTSSECPYCTSPIQRSAAHVSRDRIPADGVLPFLVDSPKAAAQLKTWIQSRWFLPGELKKRGVAGKFQGVYLPYWTYDSHTANQYSGERGEHYYVTVGSGDNKRKEQRTRWYPASGAFQRFFDDVLVVAGRGLPDHLLQALEPWPLPQVMAFNQQVLAGYLARTYDVPLDEGFAEARRRMAEAIESEVRRRIGGDTQRVHSIRTHYGAITFKHLLLPVWMMAYHYGNRTYPVVINACTAEVQGERPYSWIKITLFVGVLAAVVATTVLLLNAG